MSQDPQPEHSPNLEKPYTDPSAYEEIPSPPPAEVPRYPYQDSPSVDRGQPSPYGEYQRSYYEVPPQGTYSTLGYSPDRRDYGYQTSSPLPLNEAIKQLPNQYSKVLTKPSPFTFAAEMGKASWDILWVQLIAYAVIGGVLSFLYNLMPGALNTYSASTTAYSPQFLDILQATTRVIAIGSIVGMPITFFIQQGLIYLLAKAFGGTGTFLRQSYTSLLSVVPIGIISNLLVFIPILGGLVAFCLSIYGILLQVISLMPVHRLGGGKATAVFFIAVGILFVLLFILLFFVILVLVVAYFPQGGQTLP